MNKTVEAIQADVSTLAHRMAEMQREYMELGKNMLHTHFKSFFDITPEISAIHWTQYTPYFADGDECVFGVNSYWYDLVGYEDLNEDRRYDGGGALNPPWHYDYQLEPKYANDPTYIADRQAYETLLQTIGTDRAAEIKENLKILDALFGLDDDVFKVAFGDHSEITATATGFTTEEYEHD